MSNINIINTIWQSPQKQLPSTDCIVFADDKVILLDFQVYYDPNTKKSSAEINPLCDSTLQSFLKYNKNIWVSVDEWKDAHFKDDNRCYIGGDGAYGNEGFLACEDLQGNLIWAMFFTNTNPIAKIKIEHNYLIATTEHGEIYLKINLNNITEIEYLFDNQ